MLFALIAVAMCLMVWNLSSWKQLPSLLDHLLAGLAAVRHYQPADHTVMGSTAAADPIISVLPTEPFQVLLLPNHLLNTVGDAYHVARFPVLRMGRLMYFNQPLLLAHSPPSLPPPSPSIQGPAFH